jgi:hypothetical protein
MKRLPILRFQPFQVKKRFWASPFTSKWGCPEVFMMRVHVKQLIVRQSLAIVGLGVYTLPVRALFRMAAPPVLSSTLLVHCQWQLWVLSTKYYYSEVL